MNWFTVIAIFSLGGFFGVLTMILLIFASENEAQAAGYRGERREIS